MADRNVAKPGEESEEPREIVELDKDERWQSRLEEARARREIALREKANQPQKKRKKPWEEDDEDDDFTIEPIIQAKPDDEPELDFADRLEVMREAPKEEPVEPDPEPPRAKPKIKRAPTPPKVRDFDQIIPPEVTPAVAAPPPPAATAAPKMKPRRSNALVSDDAPNVYDLAQRYAATLKPPRNVTEPFDTIYSEPTPEPEPVPYEPPVYTGPPRLRRNRRPFGLGLVVLAFSLIPLAQMAPPLEKGPEQPATPFFGLPPALGLTTSLVWLPESFPTAPSLSKTPGPLLALAPNVDLAPVSGAVSLGPALAVPALPDQTEALTWTGITRPEALLASPGIATLPDVVPPSALPPMQSPRPQPKSQTLSLDPELAPSAAPEAASDVQTGTVVDTTDAPRDPAVLKNATPDASPTLGAPAPETPAPLTPSTTLNVTILVPEGADFRSAEDIARKAQADGHALTRIRAVDVSISERNVRYFHNDDRPAATRLAREHGAEVKDFTWFRPLPEKGTTEIWLSGRAGSGRTAPLPEATATVDQPPAFLVIRRKPTLLERILTGSNAEIEVLVPNPDALFDPSAAGQN